MRKIVLLLSVFAISSLLLAQEGHKLVGNIDVSFGIHYMFENDEANNAAAIGTSLGYEYDVNMFFGIEAGFRAGGFNQNTGYDEGPNINPQKLLKAITDENTVKGVYKGMYWAPYIAPKLYLPIGYSENKDRARYIFIENRFSYTRANMDKDEITGISRGVGKSFLQYEIRGGYQFPLDERWAMTCWIGYNTFDFSKIRPDAIMFKNSTPIQLGIGFNYIIKQ